MPGNLLLFVCLNSRPMSCRDIFIFLFELMLNVPVNSYGAMVMSGREDQIYWRQSLVKWFTTSVLLKDKSINDLQQF